MFSVTVVSQFVQIELFHMYYQCQFYSSIWTEQNTN